MDLDFLKNNSIYVILLFVFFKYGIKDYNTLIFILVAFFIVYYMVSNFSINKIEKLNDLDSDIMNLLEQIKNLNKNIMENVKYDLNLFNDTIKKNSNNKKLYIDDLLFLKKRILNKLSELHFNNSGIEVYSIIDSMSNILEKNLKIYKRKAGLYKHFILDIESYDNSKYNKYYVF